MDKEMGGREHHVCQIVSAFSKKGHQSDRGDSCGGGGVGWRAFAVPTSHPRSSSITVVKL
jgi:hypothetical protein